MNACTAATNATHVAAEGGFIARAVGESIFTAGDTLEAVRAYVRDAVECHFEEGHIPKIIRLLFVRDEG